VEPTVPSGNHTWADLLRLGGAVRQLAFDRSPEPEDALRRIRDRFAEYDDEGARRDG
jgi:hypothetical protein